MAIAIDSEKAMDANVLQQYGGYGMAVALAAFVMYLMKEHKKERREWYAQLKELFESNEDRQKETNQVLRDNTGILNGLKSLLEIKTRSER